MNLNPKCPLILMHSLIINTSARNELKDAAKSSAYLLKEGLVDVVKLEGGRRVVPQVEAIVGSGVAVVGHIGLTPQSQAALGGMRCQGKSVEAARALLEDALALEEAGCFAIVLECIPSELAAFLTERHL